MASRPKALVYRGPAVDEGCPESVAELLQSSPWNFQVAFAGPEEDVDVDAHSLEHVQVFAFPGGPDLDDAWKEVKHYEHHLQKFVSNGGHYLGFCLGAYLAGYTPGFKLLPKGADVDSECEQPNSQVKTDDDTIIQVDWTFVDGSKEHKKWLYFQEGPFIEGLKDHEGVIARYSKSGHVAASVTKYGKGRVGLVGPHPEADEEWYSDEDLVNPDGISFKIGYDLIRATLEGTHFDRSLETSK